jgi:hypothetical protein
MNEMLIYTFACNGFPKWLSHDGLPTDDLRCLALNCLNERNANLSLRLQWSSIMVVTRWFANCSFNSGCGKIFIAVFFRMVHTTKHKVLFYEMNHKIKMQIGVGETNPCN